ncbi:MAG: hypothetical protein AAF665_12215 [Pseudomonadota bacterium]
MESGSDLSLDVHYDIACIPKEFRDVLRFRDETLARLNGALEGAGLGSSIGSSFGPQEIIFSFSVKDIDAAERVVRAAVANTAFEQFRAMVGTEQADWNTWDEHHLRKVS